MKKFKISYHLDVQLDVKNAKKWYKKQLDGLENRFSDEIKKGIGRISKNPEHYQLKHESVRVLFTETFPYGIHFQLNEASSSIIILGIFHTSQNPDKSQSRIR